MLKRESLPIAKIYVPAKRRATLKPGVVREIAESMLEIGQQTPILVRCDGDRFVLVEGLHRLEACKALGEETITGYLVSAQGGHQTPSSPYDARQRPFARRRIDCESCASQKRLKNGFCRSRCFATREWHRKIEPAGPHRYEVKACDFVGVVSRPRA